MKHKFILDFKEMVIILVVNSLRKFIFFNKLTFGHRTVSTSRNTRVDTLVLHGPLEEALAPAKNTIIFSITDTEQEWAGLKTET